MRLLLALLVAVSAQAATTLQVEIPNSSTSGVPFNVLVTARSGPAVDTAYAGTVHFTSSDPAAVLPADYTFTPGDAGKHTFQATMNTTGLRTLTVTDTVTPAVNGTDDTNVHPSEVEVRRFFISAPAVVDRTVPFQVEVRALNAAHEVVTNYTGTIHFLPTRDEIVPADYTFTLDDAGRHTFTVTATRGGYSLFGVRDVANPTINNNVDQITVLCPELVASATNSGPVCQGGQATLFGNANLPAAAWYWRSEQGRVGPPLWESHEQNPVAYAGTYILTVTQANECTASARTTIAVHQPAVPQVTLSTDQLCGDRNLEATLMNPASFSGITWSVDGGTIVSGQGTPHVEIAPNAGSDKVWLAIDADETSSGCSAYRFVDEVPAGGPLPSAVVEEVAVLCDAAQATIDVTLSGTPPFRLVWSDGFVQENITTLTTTRTVSNAGAYLIAQVSDAHCSGTATGAVEVGFGEMPAVTNDPRETTIRSGERATLTVAATGGGLRYHWYEGRAGDRTKLVSSELDPSFTTPVLTRTTSYWVEVENDCGTAASRAATVAVSNAGGRRRSSRS